MNYEPYLTLLACSPAGHHSFV